MYDSLGLVHKFQSFVNLNVGDRWWHDVFPRDAPMTGDVLSEKASFQQGHLLPLPPTILLRSRYKFRCCFPSLPPPALSSCSTASRRWVGAGRRWGLLQRKVVPKFVSRAKQTWLPPRWVWLRRGRFQEGREDLGNSAQALHTSRFLCLEVPSQFCLGTTPRNCTTAGNKLSQF